MAIKFNGTSQYLYTLNDTLFNTVTTAVTHMCWINHTNITGTQAYGGRPSGTSGTSGNHLFELGAISGKPVVEITTNSTTVDTTSSTTTLVVGTWYHICGQWDSTSQTCKLYVNGVLDTSGTVSGTTIPTASSAQMQAGAQLSRTQTALTQLTAGSLEDWRVYNRLLSANE